MIELDNSPVITGNVNDDEKMIFLTCLSKNFSLRTRCLLMICTYVSELVRY